ncbi:MAG: hypothetical protein ACREGH_01895 [Minisyncoccia bacterium]
MQKEELKEFLVEVFPNFVEYWKADDNLFKESDGSYTNRGLLSHFSACVFL